MSDRSLTMATIPIRRLVGGMAVYAGADGLAGVVRLALAALYTRILVPAEFGLFAVVQVTVMLLSTGLSLGLPDVLIVRIGKQDPRQSRLDQDRVFTILLAACGIGSLAVWALTIALGVSGDIKALVPWAMLWGTAIVLWFVPGQSLRYRQRVTQYSVAKLTQIAVMVAILLTMVWRGNADLKAIVIAEALGAVMSLIVAHVLDGYMPVIRRDCLPRTLLAGGAPFCLLAIGGVVLDLADRYVIASLMGVEAAGYYAVAARIAVVGALMTTPLNTIWQPYFYRIASAGSFNAAQVRLDSRRLAMLFTTAVTSAMIALPHLLTVEVFGRTFVAGTYHGSAVLVAPLFLQYFAKVMYFLSTPAIAYNGRTWRQFAAVSVAGVVSIAINAATARFMPGPAFNAMFVIAMVTGVSYLGVMAFAIAEVRRLYPGGDLGWGFTGLLTVAALLPLLGLPTVAIAPLLLIYLATVSFFYLR